MTLPLPPRVDPHFARIAQKLSVLELMAGSDSDLSELEGGMPVRGSDTFLNFYSPEGVRAAMDALGMSERLEEAGLAPNELVITREDAFHHRLQLFIDGGHDDDHRVMDLRIHLRNVAAPGEEEEGRGPRTYGVMVIEWLSMQNPHAQFTNERPRLPGQSYPGTGFGRALHNILMLIADRLRRDAILNVPEYFHLAAIYQVMGYRYPSIAAERELEAVRDVVKDLRFVAGAWAVERGFVRATDEEGREDVWRYRPVEMMLPISSDFRARLPGLAAWMSERLFHPLEFELSLDLEGFRQSLRDDPVEHLDPDDLLS